MVNRCRTVDLTLFPNSSRSRVSGESALRGEFKNADPSSLGVVGDSRE